MSGYADQEELDKLKAWWKNYGSSVIVGLLLGVGLLVGFRYWTQYTEERRHAAAILYENMFQHYHDKNYAQARIVGESLVKDFSSTPYAEMSGLLLARLAFEAGDTAEARRLLRWVVDHADAAGVRHAARLRLGRLLLDGGEREAAMILIDIKDRTAFEAEYAELKGDILVAQGQSEAARSAYEEALKLTPANSPYVQVLRMKRDDLGSERSS